MSEPPRPPPGHARGPPLVERIDALLPQTQCTRCGYAGCRPYAEALAQDGAALNRCPPGGQRGIEALGTLLGREPSPLDPTCGTEEDPGVAWIDAHACIGCARCLPACPVDAIVGAARYLHGVYEADCNGCRLCLTTCPVDCISMRPRSSAQHAPAAADNRRRFEHHQQRLQRQAEQHAALLQERKRSASSAQAPVCP